MPSYVFVHKISGKVWNDQMKIAEMEKYLEENPDVELVPSSPLIVSGVNVKPDKGFREVLNQIKKKNPRGKVNDFGG